MAGMRVQALQKSEWNGASLTNIRVLHSYSASTMRGGTELSVWREPESPYMRTARFAVPTSPVSIQNFIMKKAALADPPFRATQEGTALNLEAIDESKSQPPKRNFDLVDD